jgi:glycosyltransferase involved in cell wall biosynthesis
MRILLISASYPPARGGVADYTQHLARAIADLGHEVRVLTSREPRPAQADDDHAAVEIIRAVPRWDLAGLGAIVRTALQFKPELIGLQYVPMMYGRGGVAPGIALLPLSLRRAARASIVAVLHELAMGWSVDARRAAQAIAHRVQLKLLSLGCHNLVVTNPRYAEQLAGIVRHPAAARIIPVGANILPVGSRREERAAVRREFGEGAGPVIGSLSALSVGDQPEDLLFLLQRLRTAHLALLGGLPGDSPRRPFMEKLARQAGVANRITWTGYLPSTTLSRALAALDVYVHTRDVGASTRSTALAAALAHGLPIVAYRGSETCRLFVDEENILLATPGVPGALAECVARLLASAELRARLSAGACELYERHFTWRVIAQQFVEAGA